MSDKYNSMDQEEYEKIFGKNHGALNKEQFDQLNVTIPKGFSFNNKRKEKTIREKKFEQWLEQLVDEEEKHINYVFRAKPVPDPCRKPLFDQITKAQAQRREEIKKNSLAMTMQNEKPFSFYERDKEKILSRSLEKKQQSLSQDEQHQFNAKPVPWFCQVPLLQRMNEQEEAARKERVTKYAQESLGKSKLPPRMEKYYKEKEEKELRDGSYGRDIYQQQQSSQYQQNNELTFQPPRARSVPDFNKIYNIFKRILDSRKSSKRPTKPIPFKFQDTRKLPERKYMDQENLQNTTVKESEAQKRAEKFKKLSEKPKNEPKITKSVKQQMEIVRKRKQVEETRKNQLEKEEQERQQKKEKLKARVQNSYAIKEVTEKLNENKKKAQDNVIKQLQKTTKEYKKSKKEMLDRVKNRPLLVESITSQRDKTLTKMIALRELEEAMKQQGVKNPRQYFSEEERELLEDADFLQKNGFANQFQNKQRNSESQSQESSKLGGYTNNNNNNNKNLLSSNQGKLQQQQQNEAEEDIDEYADENFEDD